MRAFLRFLAAVFLLVAVIAAVYDGTRSMAAGGLVTTSLLEHASRLTPALLASVQAGVKRAAHPLVWDLGLAPLLRLPTCAAFALVGLLLGYAGRRRRRVNVFAN